MSGEPVATRPELIILDRDGVINEDSDAYIKSPEEWLPIPGSLEAIARLNQAGFTIAVASNQSGLARGYFDTATLTEMHQKMADLLAQQGGHIDALRYCPHGPNDGCDCRKPQPGMLLSLLKDLSISADKALFVGDSYSDYLAATAAEIPFVLLLSGKGQQQQKKFSGEAARVPCYANLASFTDQLLGGTE